MVKRAKKELNEKELERFKIEYESMKKLNSPYIVEVYSYNEIKKEYYMEFMDFTLGDYINENNAKLSIEKKKNICRQVLRAFQYIHSNEYCLSTDPLQPILDPVRPQIDPARSQLIHLKQANDETTRT